MRIVRDVINTRDVSVEYVVRIADMAQVFYKDLMTGDNRNYGHLLDGWNVVPIFSQESTRTHDSFIEAFVKMGASRVIGISDPAKSSLAKEESIADTVDTYVGYGANFIVMRDGREGAARWAQIAALRSFSKRLREFASSNKAPPKNLVLPVIFNGGDGSHNHPSQQLLDCATMKYHFDRFTNMRVGIMNDLGASRVFASQVDAAASLGWNLDLYAIPGAEMREREERRLQDTGAYFRVYETFQDFLRALPSLDVLYVHRFQKNLRDGQDMTAKCEPVTLELLQKNGFRPDARVMHARPIDKNVKEIGDSLRYHQWNISGIQSDFGIPTRMAMAYYVIKNGLFSLEGVVRSLDPGAFEFDRKDLSQLPQSSKTGTDYTTAYINRGYVIDHIPRGCGTIMHNLIEQLFPDATVVLSSNVRGSGTGSAPKDVIKVHGDFDWPYELTNMVALLTDPYAEKSCRVSKFIDGKRVEKWELKDYPNGARHCSNPRCVTDAKYGEGAKPGLREREDHAYECTFCHTIQ